MKVHTIINNLEEAERALQKYVPNVAKLTGDDLSLHRIAKLMSNAGNPQDELKTIHVAGTSGKTSTCYYLANILQQSGKKVALTVSPHVESITERIQINGSCMRENEFCHYLNEFLGIVEETNTELSYFEVLIGFAFWVSVKENVDYLVLETGMGGLYDATNISSREDKICVITDVGYDHMHILGDSLEEITAQKAGIIHESNHVFAYQQSTEIDSVLQKTAHNNAANLKILKQEDLQKNSTIDLQDLPQFQKRNWLLAEQVCSYISNRDDFDLTLSTPQDIIVPGRMETVDIDNHKIILDGAHNQQKMHTFVSSYREKYKNAKACILLALKEGKEYQDVIDELKPIAEKIILTQFKTSQDLPTVSENPLALRNYAQTIGIESEVVDSLADALRSLIDCNNDQKIITGSFYLLSQVKKIL